MRYSLTTVRMAIIKKKLNNKCWLGCEEIETTVYSWWECKIVHLPWKLGSFLIKLKLQLLYDSAIPFFLSKRIEIRLPKRCLHSCVHCISIHNSQEVKTTQMSINRWVDKENVIYTCNGILYRLKRRREFFHTWQHVWTLKTLC